MTVTDDGVVDRDVAEPAHGRPRVRSDGRRQRLLVAASLAAYAGIVHLYVAVEHVAGRWWDYTAFFVVVGMAQVVLGGLILRSPGTLTVLAGVVGNVAVVGVYVVARTASATVAPLHDSHDIGLAGPADLIVTASEVVLIGLLLSLAPARTRRTAANVVLAAGAGLWLLRFTGLLT